MSRQHYHAWLAEQFGLRAITLDEVEKRYPPRVLTKKHREQWGETFLQNMKLSLWKKANMHPKRLRLDLCIPRLDNKLFFVDASDKIVLVCGYWQEPKRSHLEALRQAGFQVFAEREAVLESYWSLAFSTLIECWSQEATPRAPLRASNPAIVWRNPL